jgi:hypothetical protein
VESQPRTKHKQYGYSCIRILIHTTAYNYRYNSNGFRGASAAWLFAPAMVSIFIFYGPELFLRNLASQEIPCLLLDPKVQYRAQKSLALVPVRGQMESVHNLGSYFSLRSILHLGVSCSLQVVRLKLWMYFSFLQRVSAPN